MYKIPLRNKYRIIVDYCVVSEEDYEHLNKMKWNVSKTGYISGCVQNKLWRIHRYIMINLMGYKNVTRMNYIDHINGNKLDNRRENLRVVTASENAKNKSKAINASSKYYGVIKYYNDQYLVSILDDKNERIYAIYKTELHAAYQYNLWVKEFNKETTKVNNIEKPDNFIKYSKKVKTGGNIPKGIVFRKTNETYFIKYKGIYYKGSYKTLKEAEYKLAEVKQNIKLKRAENIESTPIKRNQKGECIIELYNKKKEKTGETIVDEEDYYELIKYSIHLNYQGYVNVIIDNKKYYLARYILKYNGENYVDHINNNPLDNRKCNLRIVTPMQNMMNRTSSKSSTSKHIGVSYCKKSRKWVSSIRVNQRKICIGYFDDEIEAAKARDIATKEHYGEYGKLNFHNG